MSDGNDSYSTEAIIAILSLVVGWLFRVIAQAFTIGKRLDTFATKEDVDKKLENYARRDQLDEVKQSINRLDERSEERHSQIIDILLDRGNK